MGFDWIRGVISESGRSRWVGRLEVGVDSLRLRVDPRPWIHGLVCNAALLALVWLNLVRVAALAWLVGDPAPLILLAPSMLLALWLTRGPRSMSTLTAAFVDRQRAAREFWLTAHGVHVRDGFVPYDDVTSASVRDDGRLVLVRQDGRPVEGPALDPDERDAVVAFVVRHLEARPLGAPPAALARLREGA